MKDELKRLIKEWRDEVMRELGYPEYTFYDYSFANFLAWLDEK